MWNPNTMIACILSSVIVYCMHLVKTVTIATECRPHNLFLQNMQGFTSIILETNLTLKHVNRHYQTSTIESNWKLWNSNTVAIAFFPFAASLWIWKSFLFCPSLSKFFSCCYSLLSLKNGSFTYRHRQDQSF